MWMKNTYISLDMIFIRADGRILRIAENTEPMSTRIIPSRGLAKGVLEVIAGTAKKYGIEPGDRVGASALQRPVSGAPAALLVAALSVYRHRFPDDRGIAQPGSAAVLGTAGRWFESSCPDQKRLDSLSLFPS